MMTITDDMIEAGARALYEARVANTSTPSAFPFWHDTALQDLYRNEVRAVFAATLKGSLDVRPYTSAELMRMAVKTGGPEPLDPLRVLATYAEKKNWRKVNAPGDDGKPRNYWAWAGPTIVGYEFGLDAIRATVANANGGDA